ILFLEVAKFMGEYEIPDLVVLQYLSWQDMVDVSGTDKRLGTIEALVPLVPLQKRDVGSQVFAGIAVGDVDVTNVIGQLEIARLDHVGPLQQRPACLDLLV